MYPHHHLFLHRGPSRLIWFLVGAGVATCWHRSAIMHHFPCVRQDADSAKSTSGPDQIATRWQTHRDWEQDREHWRHLQKRAGETAADLSESTLDSIVTAAESLKAKLAELRTERERLEGEKKVAHPAA